MMTFFIVWIVGSVLSYPRMVASFYEIEEDYPPLKPDNSIDELVTSLIFTWVTFIAGIWIYFRYEEKYFWKWGKSDLRKKYNETYNTK